MKKTILPALLSLLLAQPASALDLEKPPEFKRSAEERERVQKQPASQIKAEKRPNETEFTFPDGHDPRDHDHDHDDAEDIDHTHDDPHAHKKQLELLEEKGIKDESSWWPF